MRRAAGAILIITVTLCRGAQAQAVCEPSESMPDPDADTKAAKMELAQELENPLADVTYLVLQNAWDFGIGPAAAKQYTLSAQPVIPLSLGREWSLITRTTVPAFYARSQAAGGETIAGLGDITQSLYLSPRRPWKSLLLGLGPIIRYPTATKQAFGGGKWAMGPSCLAYTRFKGMTDYLLLSHLWSFAGADRPDFNGSYIEFSLAYTFPTATTAGLNSQILYDWNSRRWLVPLNLTLSQLFTFGKQSVRIRGGWRYFVERYEDSPDWGLIFQILFPFHVKLLL